jgi:hypothetical protein
VTTDLVLYVRDGCHLCEQFLLDLTLDFPVVLPTLRTVDVDTDPSLAAVYGLRVPVLEAAGQAVCEGRYDRSRVGAALGL